MVRLGKLKKYLGMFLSYTYDCVKGYVMGLIPRTQVIYFTNLRCRRMISISRRWLGKDIKESEQYELNEINPELVRLQKKNLPRIQEVIQEYEEEHGEIIVDKTEMNHI